MDEKTKNVAMALENDPGMSSGQLSALGEILQNGVGGQCAGCSTGNESMEARIARIERQISQRSGGTMSPGSQERGIGGSYEGGEAGVGGVVELESAKFNPDTPDPNDDSETGVSAGSTATVRPFDEDEAGKLVGQNLCSIIAIADDALSSHMLSIRADLKVNGRDRGNLFDVPLAYFNVDADGDLRRFPIKGSIVTQSQPVSIEVSLNRSITLANTAKIDIALETGEECKGY